MAICRSLLVKNTQSFFNENVTLNDKIKYEINLKAWEGENSTVTSVDWLSRGAGASITSQNLENGKISALLHFVNSGLIKIKITLTTSTIIKNIWLNFKVSEF